MAINNEEDRTLKHILATTVAGLILAGSALAGFPGGTYTIAPGENRKVYEFVNMSGVVIVETDTPINVRWISMGEKQDFQVVVTGITELRLPQKIEGRLEAGNPNALPATVHISRRTQVANIAQSWVQAWGSVAGGPNSEVNKAHREVKRWIKKCFGLCKG